MKGQYEQHYNAEGLKDIGISVISKLKKKNIPLIEYWVHQIKPVQVYFPDQTQSIVDKVISDFVISTNTIPEIELSPSFS